MTMADLLMLMADVNQRDAFERLAEEGFPDDGPPDFVRTEQRLLFRG